MKKVFVAILLALVSTSAWAATVRLDLAWTVTNDPASPATDYRVEEDVGSVWTAVATVPASQMTYSIPGRAIGSQYTFRIIPVRNGVDGSPSNQRTCGAVGPDTTITFTCNPVVEP